MKTINAVGVYLLIPVVLLLLAALWLKQKIGFTEEEEREANEFLQK